MAMKEIAIQPGETKAIQSVAEELKIFEGIIHKHLVKLYGVEVHRVSANLFFSSRSIHLTDNLNSTFNRKSYLFSWNCVQKGLSKVS